LDFRGGGAGKRWRGQGTGGAWRGGKEAGAGQGTSGRPVWREGEMPETEGSGTPEREEVERCGGEGIRCVGWVVGG
jgi:hypothetical protein